jgi:hypothetical protein
MDSETNVITAILGIENDTSPRQMTSQPRYLRIHTRATGGLLLDVCVSLDAVGDLAAKLGEFIRRAP